MKRFLFAVLVLLPMALAAEAAPTAAGSVVSVMGQVTVRRQAADELPAKVGSPVFTGDTVITGPDSAAKVMAADQSILDLGPSTAFRIEELEGDGEDRQAASAVDFGQVRASVNRKIGKKGKFLMRTRSSVMAVRGTEFVVSSEASPVETKAGETGTQFRLLVSVLDGKVEVSVPAISGVAPVILSPGQQLKNAADLFGRQMVMRTAADRAGEMIAMSPAQLQAMARQARMEDQNFRQHVVVGADAGGRYGRGTMGYLANNLVIPAARAPKPEEIVTPGKFNSLESFSSNQTYSAGSPINIRVVVSP